MKKPTLFIFTAFFFMLFLPPLSAQERETRIFVPPLDGTGYIDDMAYFFKQITGEIVGQYRTLGRTRRTSDYVITGRVMPIEDLNEPIPLGAENDTNVLFVELFDNELGEVISDQFVTYSYPDEATNEMLSVIIYNMLSVIPDSMEGTFGSYDAWRNKRLYLNINFLWVPRVYTGQQQSVNIAGVGAEALVDFHIFRFLAVKAGVEITPEWVVMSSRPEEQTQDMIMSGTAALAFVLRPQDIFMLEPYVGAQYNFSLQNKTEPYPISWTAGFQLGIRTGLGIITIDPRFSMDIGESKIDPNIDTRQYWRYTMHLGIGYKIGFFNRKS